MSRRFFDEGPNLPASLLERESVAHIINVAGGTTACRTREAT